LGCRKERNKKAMRAVLQRVLHGRVSVNSQTIAEIQQGLVILLGVEKDDSPQKASTLVHKISNLRIFSDPAGKMNLSILDIHGSALVVSQFTLLADTRKGNRPSFIEAAPPDLASPLVDFFVDQLSLAGILTQKGQFGAHMLVEIANDGPVTIQLQV
jgi:D-aminoacyl-tRNA deacylase